MVRSVSDMAAELQTPESSVRRFTVDEFDQMFETGILGPDERVELVEGEIIARETMNAPHASMVWRIQQHLQRALGDRAAIWAQLPVIMSGPTLTTPFSIAMPGQLFRSERSTSWPSARTTQSASSSSSCPVGWGKPVSSSSMRSMVSLPPASLLMVDSQRITTPSSRASSTSSACAGMRSRVRR